MVVQLDQSEYSVYTRQYARATAQSRRSRNRSLAEKRGVLLDAAQGGTRREVNHHNGTHKMPNNPVKRNTDRQPNRGLIAATTKGAAMLPKLILMAPNPPPRPISAGSRYVAVALATAGMPADSPRPSPMRQ